MNTNTANAKKTNSTRWRMSGTSSAARRLFSKLLAFDCGARGLQSFARTVREKHVAEAQTAGKRFTGFTAAEDLHAVLRGFDLLGNFERLRRDFNARVPIGQIVQIHDRKLRAEMSDVASLLRIAAAMREPALPGRLSAFERRAFAAAGTHRLTFAAFAAGLNHAGTVTAAHARAFGPAARCRLDLCEFENRTVAAGNFSFGSRLFCSSRSLS